MKKKYVFLDRDGTIIEEVDFLSTTEETKLFPYTVEALSMLRDAGYSLAVTTNQSGIARGYFGPEEVDAIHEKIAALLEPGEISIQSFHFCPHLPDAGCDCRKPGIGMIESAAGPDGFERMESWVIGDKSLDVEMGFNAGIRTALVLTGYGEVHQRSLGRKPDVVAKDLLEAAKAIIGFDP